MIALIVAVVVWLSPVQQGTAWCYGLHEPWKHWPVYLEMTEQLDACTMNWYTAPQFLEEPRHWPSVWNPVYRPSVRQLVAWSDAYPGRTWLLFNEPERIDQADTSPFDAAIHVRYWTEAIGDNGRTACCGVLIQTNWHGWAEWLRLYLQAGGPVPNYWHIHIYADTPEQFDAALATWDAWNAERGGGLPTIISEVGRTYAVQEHARAIQRDDIPAMFWFGLPIEPEPKGAESAEMLTYFPLLRIDN